MDIHSLYTSVKARLSVRNLQKLTLTVLDAKKNNNQRQLQSIHQFIFKNDLPEEKTPNKLFLGLVKIFHPDRLAFISAELEKAIREDDLTILEFYSRILSVLDESPVLPRPPERIDTDVDENYQYDADDFDDDFRTADAEYNETSIRDKDFDLDFLNAVKSEFLGSMNAHFNSSDLASINGELDLSDYGIFDLNGIASCTGIIQLNLSANRIGNIFDLSALHGLKELYLSDNHIHYIDSLGALSNLEILDISNNEIEDISPLLYLETLKFVNLIGNPVSDSSLIDKLKKRGVMVF